METIVKFRVEVSIETAVQYRSEWRCRWRLACCIVLCTIHYYYNIVILDHCCDGLLLSSNQIIDELKHSQ